MKHIKSTVSAIVLSTLLSSQSVAGDRPNIIIVFADDISARELPIYGSSTWSPPVGGSTSDPQYRASTPVLDQLASEGCYIKTAWASVVCSPSRAMMMTGRFAHLHKWWGNKSKGQYIDEKGKQSNWPLYLSSPHQIGHIAQQAGYGTYWSGKTQMAGDLNRYGFDQGCFTPGNLGDTDNPFTDFKLVVDKSNGKRIFRNADSNQPVDTYQQHGWYWFPHIRLMNHGGKDFQWWPNTDESRSQFGVETYGPDVELDFVFDFMAKKVSNGEPFFVYHTSHLGHDAYDWLNPDSKSKWPGTPVVNWDGEKYTRTQPNITGDAGDYDTHGTVTPPGIHHHVNYLDYQVWLYQNKLKELGIDDNTIFVFCADNGTSGYGKNSTDRQKGTHVPLIISAPGLTKRGEQDVLVSFSDFLPTIAELTGTELPEDYEINGESLVPFLFGDRRQHRDWLYGYKDSEQIIRGKWVMRDGRGKWWDVEKTPDDLISFPPIQDWTTVSAAHRAERDKLQAVLPRFDQAKHGKHGPGVKSDSLVVSPRASRNQEAKQNLPLTLKDLQKQTWTVTFEDDYEGRDTIGNRYTTARGHDDSWSVKDGLVIGKQTKDDHGAVIRTELEFDDVDIQFDFRFTGGTSFNVVIDDADEKSVHAGHICRASIFPKYLMISDDKTGAMNLEVRKQRADIDLTQEKADVLKQRLDRTRASAKVAIIPNQWHRLRLRVRGDTMKAFLDNEVVTTLKSPGFAHPTKTKFGFTVNGQSIEFDNLVVRQPSEPLGVSPRASQKPSLHGRPAADASRLTVSENTQALTQADSPSQPNILWIITDDHRADSIAAYNVATTGRRHSELGFVSSPSADALARQGVLFTRAYCNSPGCAPSRTSMHFGMYPHHCGQYGFEMGHQSADFCKPMFPKLMAELGYQTALFGKSGFSSFEWGAKKLVKTSPYQFSIDQKELYAHERVDWFHRKTWANGKASGDEAFWAMADGGIYIHTPINAPLRAEDAAKKKRVERELDLLYRLGDNDGLVIGGVSPQPTSTTQDGNILAAFSDYLQHSGETYETPWGRKVDGPPTDQPLFANLGFHFPHTPVLPSKEFRDQFAGTSYHIPEFNKGDLERLPPQLVQWFNKCNFADMKAEEKQQAIRDYYAFCAMGDFLVGKAVEQFKSFSKSQDREWVILYVIGDHGWHLGEQGGESKFAPYDTSNHCAVIVVSSDRQRYPAGTVCDNFVEFVDFAPTCLNLAGADLHAHQYQHLDGATLDAVRSGKFSRDYVIGEMNHVIGPRAYLRSNDFAFSMRVRARNGKPGEPWGHRPGEGVRWALEAPRNSVEMALFDLRTDTNEQRNVADDPHYRELAHWFREKLGRIVLGDGRIECDWKKQNDFSVSKFASGAHDGRLDIPSRLIPVTSTREP
jgi:arylsulfatase A-like enzyme